MISTARTSRVSCQSRGGSCARRAIARSLDAGASDSLAQWFHRGTIWDVHGQPLLAARQRPEVGDHPIQTDQMQQALGQPDRQRPTAIERFILGRPVRGRVGRGYPLHRIADAQNAVLEKRHVGKIVLAQP